MICTRWRIVAGNWKILGINNRKMCKQRKIWKLKEVEDKVELNNVFSKRDVYFLASLTLALDILLVARLWIYTEFWNKYLLLYKGSNQHIAKLIHKKTNTKWEISSVQCLIGCGGSTKNYVSWSWDLMVLVRLPYYIDYRLEKSSQQSQRSVLMWRHWHTRI